MHDMYKQHFYKQMISDFSMEGKCVYFKTFLLLKNRGRWKKIKIKQNYLSSFS